MHDKEVEMLMILVHKVFVAYLPLNLTGSTPLLRSPYLIAAAELQISVNGEAVRWQSDAKGIRDFDLA